MITKIARVTGALYPKFPEGIEEYSNPQKQIQMLREAAKTKAEEESTPMTRAVGKGGGYGGAIGGVYGAALGGMSNTARGARPSWRSLARGGLTGSAIGALGGGLLGAVLKKGDDEIIADAQRDLKTMEDPEQAESFRARTMARIKANGRKAAVHEALAEKATQ